MTNLNLPPYEIKFRNNEGKIEIFDPIRRKYIFLTPEEWVRQHFINYLIHHLNYPKSLIKLEGGLTYNKLLKRSDILVYDRHGNPFMLVECKSQEVKLSQKVVEQVTLYNKKIEAPYLVITNGMVHYCFKVDKETLGVTFLDQLPLME